MPRLPFNPDKRFEPATASYLNARALYHNGATTILPVLIAVLAPWEEQQLQFLRAANDH